MKEELLRITNLSVMLDGELLLHDIDFSISKGEVIGITGLTSSGKSLFARALAGNVPFSCDALYYEGKYIRRSDQFLTHHLAYLNNSRQLIPTLSVADNMFAMRPRASFSSYNAHNAITAAREVFRELDVQIDPTAKAEELLPAEQHIVLLCKAYISGVKLIIMDGICSAYTQSEFSAFFNLKKKLGEIAFINISESTDPFLYRADRVAVMRGGTFSRFFFRHELTDNLLRAYTIDPESAYHSNISVLPPLGQESVFRATFPVDHRMLCLDVSAGESILIPGWLGPDKQLLMEHLLHGRYQDCVISGRSIRTLEHAVRHGMSVIPQTYRFSGTFPSMSVQDNLTMLSMRKTGRFGIINRRLTRFSAADFAAEYEKHMLQGSSQWNTFNLLLFRQLAGGIRVMILEDPLADLDIIARDHLLQILHFFNRQGMAIIILCSDDNHIDTYLAFCSRVLPLNGT